MIRAPSSIKKKHKLQRNESFRELSSSRIPTIDSREKKKKHNFMRKASWVSKQSYGKKIQRTSYMTPKRQNMSFISKSILDSDKRSSNQDYINSVKVQRQYEETTPDCDLLESQRRKNENMLDELEDRHDYMNSTLTLAQRHNIDFVPEQEFSPSKKPDVGQIDDEVDPESLWEVNTTPTFQETTEEMEQERLNHSHMMINADDKNSFREDSDNKFNLKLHKCDNDDIMIWEPSPEPQHIPNPSPDKMTPQKLTIPV